MTDDEKNSLHGDRDALLEVLADAGAVVKSPGRIVCPFHDDKNPSAGVYQSKADQAWRFKCQGCEICEDIIGIKARIAGKTSGQVMDSAKSTTLKVHRPTKSDPAPKVYPTVATLRKSLSHVAAVHQYTHPTTRAVEMVVFRIEPPDGKKRFLQAGPVAGGFSLGKPPGLSPIYNRGRVAKAIETIFIVEGEKCVEKLTQLGFVATTSPGGADNGDKADWSPLAGKPDVVLWPDQDDVGNDGQRKGHRHMRAVADILERLDPPPRLRWFDPTPFELPSAGDAVDYIAQHGGDDDFDRKRSIQCVIDCADPIGGASDLERMIEDVIAGRRAVIPLPWSALDRLSQALMPGSILCVCGDPGSSKSLWVIEAAIYWHQQNVKMAVYMLEEDRAYHLNRALAQLANKSDITDMRWMASNAAEVRKLHDQFKPFLDGLSRSIYAAPDKHVSLTDLADWVAERAKDGCEVIVIDPVTAADTGDKRFIEDMSFVFRVKAILRQYPKSRVIITTHPRNGAKGWSDMAGGAAYPRFSQTVFWIHAHNPPRQVLCETYTPVSGTTRDSAEVGRIIKLGKTRNGRGAGLDIGFEFDAKSLRFFERGVVVKANHPSPVKKQAEDPFAD